MKLSANGTLLLLAGIVASSSAFAPSNQRRTARQPSEPSALATSMHEETRGRSRTESSALQIASSDIDSWPSGPDLGRRFAVGYKWTSKRNYLPLAFVQAGILASLADIATQLMENGFDASSLDVAHVAAMATVASTMSGAFNASCLRLLEGELPGRSNRNVVLKTIIHATIIASIINSAYLAGVPLLSDHVYNFDLPGLALPNNVLGAWKLPEFITLTKLEVAMFIPYNAVAFAFVPPQVRPLTHAAVSATFNVAVSAVTLGYFDRWCDGAMHLLG